jgi:hypothetical protein
VDNNPKEGLCPLPEKLVVMKIYQKSSLPFSDSVYSDPMLSFYSHPTQPTDQSCYVGNHHPDHTTAQTDTLEASNEPVT